MVFVNLGSGMLSRTSRGELYDGCTSRFETYSDSRALYATGDGWYAMEGRPGDSISLLFRGGTWMTSGKLPPFKDTLCRSEVRFGVLVPCIVVFGETGG